jgi:transcriptional regulator with XRE-family HTH domain
MSVKIFINVLYVFNNRHMPRKDPLSEPIAVTQFVTEVGSRIRLMRLARGLTQADLAERAEISRLTLMAIEAGVLSSRFADIARLLWALDDQSLQAMAHAAQDEVYQDAIRSHLPRFKRRSSKAGAE